MILKLSIRAWNRIFSILFIISLLIMFSNTANASRDIIFGNQDQLAMKQLIQAVLTRNPSIEAKTLAWQASQSRIKQVSAFDDPMLSYFFAPETQNLKNQDFGQKIQLSQKLPWPGKRELRGDSARYKAKANQKNIESLRLQLIVSSVSAFADWYYIHEAIRINSVNQNLWREFHIIAEVKYSSGRASKQDTLRAEVEQAMLEHQAIVLQRKQRNIQTKINTLLNRIPDKTIPPPADLNKINKLPAVEQLRQLAIESHPEIKFLLAKKQSIKAQLELAEREYYPDFNINAGYNSLWSLDEKRFTIGVSINIPIGQSKRDAKVSEKNAQTLQLQWQIINKQAMIAGAVQRAYNNIEENIHVLALYQNKLLPLAEENLQTSKADYQSGKGNFLDLVSAEKNLIQTQLNQVQAQADYQRHLAMLAHRVGEPRLLEENFKLKNSINNSIKGGSK